MRMLDKNVKKITKTREFYIILFVFLFIFFFSFICNFRL